MTESSKIVIRQAALTDKNFILATWLKGQYFGNSYFRKIPQDLYFASYAPLLEELLPKCVIRIACDESAPDWIVGFCVYSGESLYWVYVKNDYRKRKIARLLVDGLSITTAKALTKIGQAIVEAKGMIFNPF